MIRSTSITIIQSGLVIVFPPETYTFPLGVDIGPILLPKLEIRSKMLTSHAKKRMRLFGT
jgi:hypothetical protein